MTSKTSFDNIRAWLVEIKEYAQEDVVIMLLGKGVGFKIGWNLTCFFQQETKQIAVAAIGK